MGNNNTKIPVCHTWFDQLPVEIILEVFDYLSRNDVIYTFLSLNQRFNQLILHEYPQYAIYLELPAANSAFWQNVISMIGSKIQTLKVNEYDRSISLKHFPNLKSIILSSPYNLAEDHLETILQSNQFKHLHSLQIQSNAFYFTPSVHDYAPHQDHLFEKLMNNTNSLRTFKYSSCIRSLFYKPLPELKPNLQISSLTLNLVHFFDTFSIIDHTPSLKYLTIRSNPPYELNQWSNKNQIKLEKLCLTFNDALYGTRRFTALRIDFHQLINTLTQFSSSLWYLSLNFIGCYITSSNDFPFNGVRLQRQFLELMTELKQFHLYARVTQDVINTKSIVSTFANQFWLDHNRIIAMHDKYLYTLPFHFHKLYDFTDFDHVYSNHPAILTHHRRLWYHVQFIRLKKFDTSLLTRIRCEMPKLLVISIDYFNDTEEQPALMENDARNIDVVFSHVTTLQLTCGSLENEKQWILNALPNLKHLILTHTALPLLKSELTFRFNENIERLVIDGHSMIEQFGKHSYVYFVNLQDLQLQFDWTFDSTLYEWYAELVLKSLRYFKVLRTLSISYNPFIAELTRSTPELEVKKVVDKLNMSEIEKTYEMRRLRLYTVFSRKKRIFI